MNIQKYFFELQYRFFFCFLQFSVTSICLYIYKEEIIYFLSSSQKEMIPYFISTHLTEIFFVSVKLSILLSFYLSFPFIFLQLIIFLSPALYEYEYKIIRKYIFFSLFLYTICTSFTTTIFIPTCWDFFSSFQSPFSNTNVLVHFEAKLNSYSDFFLESLFLLQFFFQCAGILVFFLPKLFPSFYKFSRKLTYFSFLVLATIITPPDLFSQILMAFFLILSYESFVFFFILTKEYKRANNGT